MNPALDKSFNTAKLRREEGLKLREILLACGLIEALKRAGRP